MEQAQAYEQSKIDNMFAELVSNHGRNLKTIIDSKIFCPSDRDDVYQNALIAVYTVLPKFRQECSLLTFAQRCFHNVIVDYIRKKKTRSNVFDDYTQVDSDLNTEEPTRRVVISMPVDYKTPEILYSMKHSSIQNMVAVALEELGKKSPEQAEVYQLMIDFFRKHDRNLSDEKISEILEIPVNTVKTRKYRARQNLREILNEEDWHWPEDY